MAALRLGPAARQLDQRTASEILSQLRSAVPSNKQPVRLPLPADIVAPELSSDGLRKRLERDGAIQLGTLGRGNHFLELQADQDQDLWLTVHSGSRALGPAIHALHCRGVGLDVTAKEGRAYLSDAGVALRYAESNRRLILERATEIFTRVLEVEPDWKSLIVTMHNFVRLETHRGNPCWVHRKGASSAAEGELGVIPGSMGSESFHVTGRGCAEALASSSHGAGRALPRGLAFRKISARRLIQEMEGVWFHEALVERLRDEAPSAYKPIAHVMRAQRELVRIVRRLRPLLSYKGV